MTSLICSLLHTAKAINSLFAFVLYSSMLTRNVVVIVAVYCPLTADYRYLLLCHMHTRSFSTKEAATHAIVGVHNTEINAQPVKCSWGKESGDPNNAQTIASQALNPAAAAAAGFPYSVGAAAAAAAAYGQQLAATGCWYSPTPTYSASSTTAAVTPAAAASAAAVQNQFLQGIQGYHFGQYGGYQQGYMG